LADIENLLLHLLKECPHNFLLEKTIKLSVRTFKGSGKSLLQNDQTNGDETFNHFWSFIG
jgi:hypothetical protein